jgi:N-acyl homoserine lactone hydrolase
MFQPGSLECKLHNIKMNQGLNEPYEIPVGAWGRGDVGA